MSHILLVLNLFNSHLMMASAAARISIQAELKRSQHSNRGRLTTVLVGSSGLIYQEFNYSRMGKVVMHRQSAGDNAFEIQYSYNPGGQLIEEVGQRRGTTTSAQLSLLLHAG